MPTGSGRLACYLFDGAVIAFGQTVEWALQQTLEIGAGDTKRLIPKYTLAEIFERGLWMEGRGGGSGDWGLVKKSGLYDEVK